MQTQISTTLEGIADEDMPNIESQILSGYHCPVCNFTMACPPSDFNICPSCGTEFGNDDADWTFEQLRQSWLESGAHWWSKAQPAPSNWNAIEQVLPLVISSPYDAEEFTAVESEQYVEITPGNWTYWRVTGSTEKLCLV